jgi:hypothetical protein
MRHGTRFANVKTMDKWVFFMKYQNNHKPNDYSLDSTRHLQAIIAAHVDWIQGYLELGWDGYLVTVMFHNLSGSKSTKIIQMRHEVERLYGHLATRMVRNRYLNLGSIKRAPSPMSR